MVEGLDSKSFYACLFTPEAGEIQSQHQTELNPSVFFCLRIARDIKGGGRYNISVKIKCVRAMAAGPTQQLSFHIIFGYRSSDEFLSISADAVAQTWTLQHISTASRCSPNSLHVVKDSKLKANILYNCVIQIRQNSGVHFY